VTGERTSERQRDVSTRAPDPPPRERRRGVDIVGIDHVQLPMPPGEEALARLFYAGVLGLTEVRKPLAVAGRGGAWFVGPDVSVHLGVEDPVLPAQRAHPAFLVGDLERARRSLEAAGVPVIDDPAGVPVHRFYIRDPFGNRIELVDVRDRGFSFQRPRR
jgi:catechol 2,3-dioxygenase-like lactoylglutathione lyase family enzyme